MRHSLLCALALIGCGAESDGGASSDSRVEQTTITTSRPPTTRPDFAADEAGCVDNIGFFPASAHAGMSVAHDYGSGGSRGYGSATSRRTLRELSALGVRWVSLTPFGFLDSVSGSEIRLPSTHPAAENDTRVRAEIRAAHGLGLRVFLKPHLWIRGGAWRGDINPERGWDAFFASYRAFILHYADMAERLSVELLAIGVEIPTSEADRWSALIAEVRERYRGEITYAANWDATEQVPFWRELDYVGVQFYPPLANEVGAPETDLRRALTQHLDGLGRLSRAVQRPVILTEVGYKSIVGAEVHPHLWPERHGRPEPSEPAQAQAYARLFNAVQARPFIRGVYLWKWFTDPESREEGADGFSPRGKLAEAVVRSAYHPRCHPM